MKNLAKGQIISKWFFDVFDFLQKTNENKSTWSIIVVKLNSFVRFLEEIEAIKNPFEIISPLENSKNSWGQMFLGPNQKHQFWEIY